MVPPTISWVLPSALRNVDPRQAPAPPPDELLEPPLDPLEDPPDPLPEPLDPVLPAPLLPLLPLLPLPLPLPPPLLPPPPPLPPSPSFAPAPRPEEELRQDGATTTHTRMATRTLAPRIAQA